ncbi:MAG: hypothetical protein FJ011_27315 [Chloroflexi bacterium]|nr:hypothetical protein [Chloroflexota bacterium]
MRMEAAIAPEAMARYRRTAQAREAARRHEIEGRRQAAWSVARQAAAVLREAFGATRVLAFGSLAHGAWFGPRSDIDLAVEGVPADAFWRAWVALDRVDPGFEIDLVAIESAPERLRDEIAGQGVAL